MQYNSLPSEHRRWQVSSCAVAGGWPVQEDGIAPKLLECFSESFY